MTPEKYIGGGGGDVGLNKFWQIYYSEGFEIASLFKCKTDGGPMLVLRGLVFAVAN